MLSVCDSVQGTLSSVWQIPFAAPAGGWYGGGGMTILSLWFREAVAYQQTIQHPNMPSTEFPFGIYIQGKELKYKKRLFSPFAKGKKKKKGNLQALLENWPIGGLEQDTFVRPGRRALVAEGRRLPTPQTLPRERGLMGKGAGGGGGWGLRCASPGAAPTPASPAPARAQLARPQLAAPDG